MATNILAHKKRKTIFFIVFTTWWCLWSIVHLLVLNDFNVPVSRAAVDSLVSNSLLAALCLLVVNNMRYYVPRQEKYLYVLIVSISLSLLWLFMMRVGLWLIYRTDSAYMYLLAKTNNIRFAIAFLVTGIITLLSLLWYTQRDQQEEQDRKIDMERLAREAELNKLRQQLQPHFLFNSLNSISALTGTQPEKARHMIQQLSDFLRGTLKKESLQSNTLNEELQNLELYLDIEKVRFGYRLQTVVVCDDETLKMKLPAMLLQPIVENAIKFGLYDTIGEVTILIKAKKTEEAMLEVTVENPFDEISETSPTGTGFGLSSIRRRLFLLFGRHDLLVVNKVDQQFITKINIPQTT